jgi:hypothetical protein
VLAIQRRLNAAGCGPVAETGRTIGSVNKGFLDYSEV